MKVLFWVERIWPEIGGIETFARQLVPAMRKRGHKMAIISSSFSTATEEKDPEFGFKMWRFPFAAAFKTRDLHQIKTIAEQVTHLIQAFQPDLIHLNTLLTSSFFFLRVPKAIRPPTLLTLHTAMAKPEYAHNLQNQILQNVDYVVGVSKATLARCLQVAPAFAAQSTIIYNGRHMPSIKPQTLRFDTPTLLCLGRLSEEKGFDIALEAFITVCECIPNAQLIIAGDGDERAALEKQAVDLGIADAVTFSGRIHPDRVPELINQSTIVVVPSRHEQFGLVALEAAQMARPVVASRVGGLKEILIHKHTGLLVAPTDDQALAESIIFLIENPDIAVSYGIAARERALNVFDFSQFIDNYDRIYRTVSGKQNGLI